MEWMHIENTTLSEISQIHEVEHGTISLIRRNQNINKLQNKITDNRKRGNREKNGEIQGVGRGRREKG